MFLHVAHQVKQASVNIHVWKHVVHCVDCTHLEVSGNALRLQCGPGLYKKIPHPFVSPLRLVGEQRISHREHPIVSSESYQMNWFYTKNVLGHDNIYLVKMLRGKGECSIDVEVLHVLCPVCVA